MGEGDKEMGEGHLGMGNRARTGSGQVHRKVLPQTHQKHTLRQRDRVRRRRHPLPLLTPITVQRAQKIQGNLNPQQYLT